MKGVGLVVLGFVLSGNVSIHDKLRMIPGASGKFAEVKGIQVNDEDQESTERGIRVGLSLKGVELKDLEKVSWLDDGTLELFEKDHIQFHPVEILQAGYTEQGRARPVQWGSRWWRRYLSIFGSSGEKRRVAELQKEIPVWEGMPISLLDLNAKSLRVMGGGRV